MLRRVLRIFWRNDGRNVIVGNYEPLDAPSICVRGVDRRLDHLICERLASRSLCWEAAGDQVEVECWEVRLRQGECECSTLASRRPVPPVDNNWQLPYPSEKLGERSFIIFPRGKVPKALHANVCNVFSSIFQCLQTTFSVDAFSRFPCFSRSCRDVRKRQE